MFILLFLVIFLFQVKREAKWANKQFEWFIPVFLARWSEQMAHEEDVLGQIHKLLQLCNQDLLLRNKTLSLIF